MHIETVEDLADKIADWCGIYGACKHDETGKQGCELDKDNPFCCRVGFVQVMEKRIIDAVENTKKITIFNNTL